MLCIQTMWSDVEGGTAAMWSDASGSEHLSATLSLQFSRKFVRKEASEQG